MFLEMNLDENMLYTRETGKPVLEQAYGGCSHY